MHSFFTVFIGFYALSFFACSAPTTAANTLPTREPASKANKPDTFSQPTSSCQQWKDPEALMKVKSKKLNEISGLAISRKNSSVFWVHEDRGNKPALYALNSSGKRILTIELDIKKNKDWEDLAIGPCGDKDCLFIGAFGDNKEKRKKVSILRIEEPTIDSSQKSKAQKVSPDIFDFRYPGGAKDAEALAITQEGLPLILSKRNDGKSEVFLVPSLEKKRTVDAILLGQLSTEETDESGRKKKPKKHKIAAVTAADLSLDGSRLLVRTYLGAWEYHFSKPGSALLENHQRFSVPSAPEKQGEAIAYDPIQNGFWQVGEGKEPFLYFVGCQKL